MMKTCDATCIDGGIPCTCTAGCARYCKSPGHLPVNPATITHCVGAGCGQVQCVSCHPSLGRFLTDPVKLTEGLSLPDDDAVRGEYPMYDGLMRYFPNALAEVSKVSKIGNDQHNPGQEMHWARDKSTDHGNKILRHMADAGKFDGRGVRHTARAAWRILAMLQEELEKDEGFPPSPASRNRPW